MNANRYRPTQAAALILSGDPMGAALLGAAVEIAGFKAAFPMDGESERECVRRLRPSHLLIDCDHPAASNESVIGPAMMLGARIFLFGAERRMRMRRHIALRFHLEIISLPGDVERLAAILALPPADASATPRT